MSQSKPGRRVVVTGLGVVTPIGTTVDEFWAGLRAGKSGVSELGGFPLDEIIATYTTMVLRSLSVDNADTRVSEHLAALG